jgi:enamine deaminase RidA (YjgF/YER057c/UK114 family)
MKKPVYAAGGAKPGGPYTPAILAGDFLYVAGQGTRDPEGNMPSDFAGQVQRCLTNVRVLVEAGGLTWRDVIYSQIYIADRSRLPEVIHAWKAAFPDGLPAYAIVGMAGLPTGIPIEINAVAVRGATRTQDGVLAANGRLYFGSIGGATPGAAMENLTKAANARGIDLGHFAFLNAYCSNGVTLAQLNQAYAPYFEPGNAPARASMLVDWLPPGVSVTLTGIAVQDLSTRRVVRPRNMAPSRTASPAVWAGDTLYLSAKSGFLPGPQAGIHANTVELQVRQTMRNLLDGLEETGLDFSHCVASNVYVDDLSEFGRMNGIYGSYFRSDPPARTTVQPMRPVERKPTAAGTFPMLEQISLIAWRP